MFKKNLQMYSETFSMCYESDESPYYGNMQDKFNANGIGMSLENAIIHLFENHKAGILITSSKSFAVIFSNSKYYFTDSHSCGPRGKPLLGDNGKSCVIECDDIFELIGKIKRATFTTNNQYTLDYINIHQHHNISENHDFDKEQEGEELANFKQERSTVKSNEIIVESHDTGLEKVVNQQCNVRPQRNLEFLSDYKKISNKASIVRASWHQANRKIFGKYAGVQCCAMSIANIVRAAILSPQKWNAAIVNNNLIAGDTLDKNY